MSRGVGVLATKHAEVILQLNLGCSVVGHLYIYIYPHVLFPMPFLLRITISTHSIKKIV